MYKQKLVFCSQKVNKKHIRRETRRGVEHIVLSSFTLPPDIVMNGGLYPADEVEKSFTSLNRTPVTIEHPELDGMFVSANDPEIDFEYRFGAFNENATLLDDGRISIDKVINVQKAMKSDKGKRLLDRINELETSKNPRAMHTSVGVFVDAEELDEPATNADGQDYGWIARNMIFDHDAILLDNIGAATPDQGTGIGINSENIKVEHFVVNDDYNPVNKLKDARDLRVNRDFSFNEVHSKLHDLINTNDDRWANYVIDVYDNYFIYELKGGETFKQNYSINSDGGIEIQGERLKVERAPVEYIVVNKQINNEDNTMRDDIIAALAKMGITVNAEISDADLMAKYNEALLAANGDDNADGDVQVNSDLAKTVQDQATEIETLKANADARDNADLDAKIIVIQTNSKYKDISEAALKAIHANNAEDFDKMHAESVPSYGIGSTNDFGGNDDSLIVNTKIEDLPE